jgi:protein-tyrosine phosphatase
MIMFWYLFDKLYPLIRFFYERVLGHRWYDEILPTIWLGGAPSQPNDYKFLLQEQVGAVVDIRSERQDDLAFMQNHGIHHLKLSVPDMVVPPPEIINEGVEFMRAEIENGRKVYVHCAKGRGRSATLVAGYLMRYEGMSFEEARDFMKSKRRLVKLEHRHAQVLKQMGNE